MSDFVYQDLLPLGADTAPYRKLTSDYVSTFEGGGQTFLKVEPEAIRLLTDLRRWDDAKVFAQNAGRSDLSSLTTQQAKWLH